MTNFVNFSLGLKYSIVQRSVKNRRSVKYELICTQLHYNDYKDDLSE